MMSPRVVRVASAAESGAADRAAIAAGVPSRALMRAAGFAAAATIADRYRATGLTRRGAVVYTGPGNNGGDGWVVGGALAASGVAVHVVEVGEPKTPDAIAERECWRGTPGLVVGAPTGAEAVIIDALLGTGATGAPRGAIGEAVARIVAARAAGGAAVVAIDVPTGVDATTGVADGAVVADLTLTFGSMKRGLLVARGHAGAIVVLDIGLGARDVDADVPVLVDGAWVASRVPEIPADAFKGTRRRLAIVAGSTGLVGAALMPARSAHVSGIGLVRLFVSPENVAVVQTAACETMARPWPIDDRETSTGIGEFAHAVLIGPGLGTSDEARALIERVLRLWRGPTVLDADALNAFAGRLPALADALAGRPALLTPHEMEMSRLSGRALADVQAARFEIGREVAAATGAAVLLKGVPTVISGPPPGRERMVSGAGTPILATGGSGDVLGGIAATLLAQTGDPVSSGAIATWVQGRAAERAGGPDHRIRGRTLDDVMAALPAIWADVSSPERLPYPILAELPRVGE